MPLSNRIDTARIRRGVPMNGLEFHKLLSERLAKYGLSVKAVTESSYMPSTGVIMMPKDRRRAGRVNAPSEARRLPNRSNPSRATQDLLNSHWQRDTIDDKNVPEDHPGDDGVDMDGLSHQQNIQQLRQLNGEEWYQENRVRLENPDVWQEYLSLN